MKKNIRNDDEIRIIPDNLQRLPEPEIVYEGFFPYSLTEEFKKEWNAGGWRRIKAIIKCIFK